MTAKLTPGARFGQLTVQRKVWSQKRGDKYVCRCACGFEPFGAKASELISGRVKACRSCQGR